MDGCGLYLTEVARATRLLAPAALSGLALAPSDHILRLLFDQLPLRIGMAHILVLGDVATGRRVCLAADDAVCIGGVWVALAQSHGISWRSGASGGKNQGNGADNG